MSPKYDESKAFYIFDWLEKGNKLYDYVPPNEDAPKLAVIQAWRKGFFDAPPEFGILIGSLMDLKAERMADESIEIIDDLFEKKEQTGDPKLAKILGAKAVTSLDLAIAKERSNKRQWYASKYHGSSFAPKENKGPQVLIDQSVRTVKRELNLGSLNADQLRTIVEIEETLQIEAGND